MTNTQKESISAIVSNSFDGFMEVFSSISQEDVNRIPYPGSWTAAQVVLHVTLSTAFMIRLADEQGVVAGREPDARVDELANIFLDLSVKLDAPEMIVPPPGEYEKEVLTENLENLTGRLLEKASRQNLEELFAGTILGDISRLELLYFVSFHTLRHTHQLNKIAAALGY